jgi:acyl-CoA reductase-like NAD-dependent aldehyde dehydrogenase
MPTATCKETGLEIVPLWINGQPRASSPSIKIEVTSAAQQKVTFLAEAANVSMANLAIQSAASAFPSWRLTSAASRRDLLLRAANIFEARREELVAFEMEETSCTRSWAEFNVVNTVGTIREMAARVTTACAGEIPTMEVEGTVGFVFKEPVGPVLIIPP